MCIRHLTFPKEGWETFFWDLFSPPRVSSLVSTTRCPTKLNSNGRAFECTRVHKCRVRRRENWANAFCATTAAWYLRSTPRNCSGINGTSLCIYDPPGDAFDRARRPSHTFDAHRASKYLLRRKITKVHEIYVDATPGRTAVSNLPSELQQGALDWLK